MKRGRLTMFNFSYIIQAIRDVWNDEQEEDVEHLHQKALDKSKIIEEEEE